MESYLFYDSIFGCTLLEANHTYLSMDHLTTTTTHVIDVFTCHFFSRHFVLFHVHNTWTLFHYFRLFNTDNSKLVGYCSNNILRYYLRSCLQCRSKFLILFIVLSVSVKLINRQNSCTYLLYTFLGIYLLVSTDIHEPSCTQFIELYGCSCLLQCINKYQAHIISSYSSPYHLLFTH